jgi:dTDP-4-amino-4,6-dideoxygalactose transaminase
MKIPFSLPYIDESVIDEVNDCLTNTSWLTSGPKVLEFENELKKITSSKTAVCVNSWTSGALLILRWFGVGEGDEVIIPSYTYSATALCVLNMGAKPVMVDVKDDFTIDPIKAKEAITTKTKVIIPVDIAGWPCDYNSLYEVIKSKEVLNLFNPKGENQKKLNRILLLSDAAHSIGAIYNSKPIGLVSDITVFSFHSVKNITCGEGGAIILNLPLNFDNQYEYLKALSLNGQNKSAFQKNQIGGWKYDIIDQGLKVNMPDICAAIGLSQIRIYSNNLLPERKNIFKYYNDFFANKPWAIIPKSLEGNNESSYHLYLLRIKDINENERDEIIHLLSIEHIGVNVHYIPMPSLTLFKTLGYDISHYPNTYNLYKNEITLPVYNNLKKENLNIVCASLEKAYNEVIKKSNINE